MITAIDTPPIVAPGPTWRIRTTGVATVLGWLLVAGAIAFSYFGRAALTSVGRRGLASSPDGSRQPGVAEA